MIPMILLNKISLRNLNSINYEIEGDFGISDIITQTYSNLVHKYQILLTCIKQSNKVQ